MNEIILEVTNRRFKSTYMIPISSILYLYARDSGKPATIELLSGYSFDIIETMNDIKDQIAKQRR